MIELYSKFAKNREKRGIAMPLISRKGKYCNKTGRNWVLPVLIGAALLLVLAVVLVLVFAFGGRGAEDPDTQTTQPTTAPQMTPDLQLPDSITFPEPSLAQPVTPADLVKGLENTGITVRFASVPDETKLGWIDVSLRFESKTQYCVTATRFYRFEIVDTVTVNLNDTRAVEISEFVSDTQVQAQFVGTDPQQVDRAVPGKTGLKILCGGREYDVTLDVVDNIAPTGTGVTTTIEALKPFEPADFVKDITDHTAVKVTFAEEIDLTVVGKHTVKLLLTDEYGNTATVEATVTVTPARLVPEFTGLSVIYIQMGESISYKSGVTCVDPQDGPLSFTVDNSGVDRMTEGRYTVTYSATDSDGNTTTVTRTVVVEAITQEKVEQYAQKVLNKIIKEGMSRDEMIYAVWRYSRKNVIYNGSSDKSSLLVAAYDGFTKYAGDCYTYYAMNTVMFELLGIEQMEVRRIGGTSNHWWSLVLFEDGVYYHVDSTPVGVAVSGIDHSKMTETDIQTYTLDTAVANRRPNFYVYDHDLPQYQGITIAP